MRKLIRGALDIPASSLKLTPKDVLAAVVVGGPVIAGVVRLWDTPQKLENNTQQIVNLQTMMAVQAKVNERIDKNERETEKLKDIILEIRARR